MKVMKSLLSAVVATGLFMAASSAMADETRQGLSSDSVIETIKKRGSLRVGMATFVPWAMRDKNGELIGFEIDVATKVAEDMGVDIEFVPTAWDGIIPALVAGKFDAIIGGMSITAKRNLTVNFTHPYASTGYILMASTERANEKGLMALEDFNQSGITIATRRASTGATAMQTEFPQGKADLLRRRHPRLPGGRQRERRRGFVDSAEGRVRDRQARRQAAGRVTGSDVADA